MDVEEPPLVNISPALDKVATRNPRLSLRLQYLQSQNPSDEPAMTEDDGDLVKEFHRNLDDMKFNMQWLP